MRRNFSSRSSTSSSSSRSSNSRPPNRNHPRQSQSNRQHGPQNDRFNYTPKEETALQLFPSSVVRIFRDLIVKNVNAKVYDETFYKLQMIMKSTFKNGKPVNQNDLRFFNGHGQITTEQPITIAQNAFDAEKWVSLYVRTIPDIKLPAYDTNWSVPFLWIFDNIQTSLDGIDRSKWITETKTFDKEIGEMERSHENYERSVAARKEHRAKVLRMLTEIIANNHISVCPSIEDPIDIPSFTSVESVYMFYALRITWLLVTLHGNHVNFGEELNQFTYLINPSKTYEIDEYVRAMKALRSDEQLRSFYGKPLSDLLAKLIENCFLLHHSSGLFNGNIPLFTKNMIDDIVPFLDTANAIIPKRRMFGDPMQSTLKLLKNRYSGKSKVEVTALLQTYPTEALKRYLLDDFVSNNALTNTMFDSFLLMHKLYDIPTIKQAIVGGFCARSTNIKVHQLAYSMVFGFIKPEECMFDDNFLDASQRIDSLVIAIENSPVDIGREILKATSEALPLMEYSITSAQATKLYDCFEKVGIKCPSTIQSKAAVNQ